MERIVENFLAVVKFATPPKTKCVILSAIGHELTITSGTVTETDRGERSRRRGHGRSGGSSGRAEPESCGIHRSSTCNKGGGFPQSPIRVFGRTWGTPKTWGDPKAGWPGAAEGNLKVLPAVSHHSS